MKNLLFITVFLCSNWALGQNKAIKSFSGNFEGGTATYSYYENNNYERIYNGKFTYNGNAEVYDNLKIYINGNYSNNMRDGKWVFSVRSIKSPVSRILNSKNKATLQLIIRMGSNSMSQQDIQTIQKYIYTGKMPVYLTYHSTLSGHYVTGKLDGVWTFNEVSTGGGKRELTNKKNLPINSTVTFKDNHLIGAFKYMRDEKNYVSGQFDNNGALDGKWIIKWVSNGNEFENISEYKNGTLIKMLERNLSTGEILSQNIQAESKGKSKMAEAILFWTKNPEMEFNQLSISKRNYMYKFDKGIIKPKIEYNF